MRPAACCLADDAWGQLTTEPAGKIDGGLTAVPGVDVVGRGAEARMKLDRAPEPTRGFRDRGAREAGVEHECLDVGVEPHTAVDVSLDVVVEVVGARRVGERDQAREEGGATDVDGIQDRVREAEADSNCER